MLRLSEEPRVVDDRLSGAPEPTESVEYCDSTADGDHLCTGDLTESADACRRLRNARMSSLISWLGRRILVARERTPVYSRTARRAVSHRALAGGDGCTTQ